MFGEAACLPGQVILANLEATISTMAGLATSRPPLQRWHSCRLRLYMALTAET